MKPNQVVNTAGLLSSCSSCLLHVNTSATLCRLFTAAALHLWKKKRLKKQRWDHCGRKAYISPMSVFSNAADIGNACRFTVCVWPSPTNACCADFCDCITVVHTRRGPFEWTLCFRGHFFGILCLGIVAPLSSQWKHPTHNVLTDHWAITAHCNYCIPFNICILVHAPVYLIFLFFFSLDCTKIAGHIWDFKNITSIFLHCFDAKVGLNFICLGYVWVIVERAK